MTADIHQEAHKTLDQVPDERLSDAVRFLKSLVSEDAETEEEWEARVLAEALAESLNADGSVDYDKLELVIYPWMN